MSNNQQTQHDAKLDAGIIKVLGPPIFQIKLDNLGIGYPSPFPTNTTNTIKFPVIIQQSSTLSFAIYTCDGREIVSSAENESMFELFNEKNVKLELSDNLYDAGSYELHFNPDNTKIASGLYFLVMKTDRGVYNTNFIYCK